MKLQTIIFLIMIILLCLPKGSIVSRNQDRTQTKQTNTIINKLDGVNTNSYVTRAIITISTTCDWTNLAVQEPISLATLNNSVTVGATASGLNFYSDSHTLTVVKDVSDTTLVTVTYLVAMLNVVNNTLINLDLTKGSNGYSTITVYNYNTESITLVSNATHYTTTGDTTGTNPLHYQIDSSLLVQPNGFVSIADIKNRRPQNVQAFYYPWYGNPYDGVGWNHWDGSPHNPNVITNGTRDIAATDYPSLDAYDSYNPVIIDQHIRMAQASGIDTFISSWWGQNTYEDHAFPTLLQEASLFNFTFTIYFETAPYWSNSYSTAYNGILNDFRYIYDNYANNTSFYKTTLNNITAPLVYIYVASHWNTTFWGDIISQLRSEGRYMFFSADTDELPYLSAFDGIHSYEPIFKTNLTDYYNTYSIGTRIMEQNLMKEKLFASTVSPGFNNSAVTSSYLFADRLNGNTFFSNLFAAAYSGADTVLITSFNEWHEGTEIENSKQYDGQYLKLLLEWRIKIDQSYHPKGNLTVLNKITDAMSALYWLKNANSSDVDVIGKANDYIDKSLMEYDAGGYSASYNYAELSINTVMHNPISPTSSTRSFSSTSISTSTSTSTSGSETSSVSTTTFSNWFLLLIPVLIVIKKVKKK